MALRRRHGPANPLLYLTVLPIAPLVDIALMLTVFLLIMAPGAKVEQLPVVLPEAATGVPATAGGLDVTVAADGTISIAGHAVGFPALRSAAHGHTTATVSADANARHGRVVAVVDELRRAGVATIYYATTRRIEEW